MSDKITELRKMEFELLRDASKELTSKEKVLSDRAVKLVTILIVATGFVEAIRKVYIKDPFILWDVLIIANVIMISTILLMYSVGFFARKKIDYTNIDIKKFSDVFVRLRQDIQIKSNTFDKYEKTISICIVWIYGSVFFEFLFIGETLLKSLQQG